MKPISQKVLKWSNAAALGLILAISYSLIEVPLAAAEDVPSATIEFAGGSVAAGLGYTWGKGTLVYQGKQYPLSVEGLSIVHVGVASYTASGTVYNLKNLVDVNGEYVAVSAGATLAGGGTATLLQNDHGVKIQLTATQQGFSFQLGPHGMRLLLLP